MALSGKAGGGWYRERVSGITELITECKREPGNSPRLGNCNKKVTLPKGLSHILALILTHVGVSQKMAHL